MEIKDIDIFSEICMDSDSEYYSDSESDVYFPKQIQPRLQPVDFEKYIHNNCQDKIKLLNRTTFHQIPKPIVIFFNHFREKCAYHIKYLDIFYELSLKYGDCIEIIAADMFDIGVINSIDFFCPVESPEKETCEVYAIDQLKRVHHMFNADKSLECLTELCENLLRGSLYISQPLPQPNNSSLVKICVHHNYTQLVTYSMKHVLLIVGLVDYGDINLQYEPNYEIVAEQLKSYNVEVVHINAEKNYIPLELGIFYYPTLLLIPQQDKRNYIDFLQGSRNEENIVHCIKSYLNDPKTFVDQQQQQLNKRRYAPLEITPDLNMDFAELPTYLKNNCHNRLKVFERETLLITNRYIIIAFMDFSKGKCSAHHLKWMDQIYQVATNVCFLREFFIADYKDIDVINPQWKPQDFSGTIQTKATAPKVIGVDLKKNKFVMEDFKTAASLFYFTYSLSSGELYASEPWPNIYDGKLVKTCIAESLNLYISLIKKNIFLSIYYSNTENTEQFLQILEEIALEMKTTSLKTMKIDARLNYIPLEMDDKTYPILYFIPHTNKSQHIRFQGNNFGKNEIANFIRKNVGTKKSGIKE